MKIKNKLGHDVAKTADEAAHQTSFVDLCCLYDVTL